MSLPFVDDFDARGVGALGSNYDVLTSSCSIGTPDGGGHCQTIDPSSGYCYVVYKTDQPSAPQKSKVKLGSLFVQGGPVLRMADTPGTINGMVGFIHGPGADYVSLVSVVNGTMNFTLGHFTESAGLTTGDDVELQVDGSDNYTLWVNGSQVGSPIHDATFSAGYAGFFEFSSGFRELTIDNNSSASPQSLSGAAASTGWAVTLGTFLTTGALVGLAAYAAWVVPAGTFVAGGPTITTPQPRQVFQRAGTTGPITVVGTYGGGDDDIEASFNGGAYATVATGTSGAFSGTLTGQPQGVGTLTVRKKNTPGYRTQIANVGVGDVFAFIGDSNSVGHGTNTQSYAGPGLASVYDLVGLAWRAANDPLQSGLGQGSIVPLLAKNLTDYLGVPVAFYAFGVGSTDCAGDYTTWRQGGAQWTAFVNNLPNSKINGFAAVLASLGPNASVSTSTVTAAAFKAGIESMVAELQASVVSAPPLSPLLMARVGTAPYDTIHNASRDGIRQGAKDAWATSAHVLIGPVLYDLPIGGDTVHWDSDANLQAIADRWFLALKAALYGVGTGRGPRAVGAAFNLPRTTVQLTFDQNLGQAVSTALTTSAFRVLDGGTPKSILSATVTGTRTVDLVVGTAVAGLGTVDLGHADDAFGTTIPIGAAITLPDARTVTLPAEPFYGLTVGVSGFPAISSWVVPSGRFAFPDVQEYRMVSRPWRPQGLARQREVTWGPVSQPAPGLVGLAAHNTWTVPAGIFTPGPKALSGAAGTAGWRIATGSFVVHPNGGQGLTGFAATVVWTVPAGTFALGPGPQALAGAAAGLSWQSTVATLIGGPAAIPSGVSLTTWIVPMGQFNVRGGPQTLQGAAAGARWVVVEPPSAIPDVTVEVRPEPRTVDVRPEPRTIDVRPSE